MRVFLSHSSKDEKAAQEVCSIIEKNGHHCFYAPRDIRSGYEYAEELVNGIDGSDAMLLLLSEDANSSPHVLREVERAVSKKIAIIVYKLQELELSKSMEYFLMTHQWVNAKTDEGYGEIVRCLNQLAEAHGETVNAVPIETEKPASAPKKGNGKLPLIIALCAVGLALIVVGVSVLLINSGDNSSIPTGTNSVADDISTSGTGGSTSPLESDIPADATSLSAQSTTENSADDPDSTPPDVVALAELGDTITFGRYLDQPIEWRVIELSNDGKSAMVIAQNILTMKAYDAAEGGKYNYYDSEYYWNTPSAELDAELERLVRGDNRWKDSNIRLWLNSDRENVQYIGQAPTQQAMSEQTNGYHTEAGFLRGFTEEERAAILTTEVITNGAVTEDKVFLLSSDEIELLYRVDVSKYAIPTATAAQQDTSRWYELNQNDYGIMDHYWWLRDANTDTASECYIINNSYSSIDMFTASAGLEGYGIRPVMTIDLTKVIAE